MNKNNFRLSLIAIFVFLMITIDLKARCVEPLSQYQIDNINKAYKYGATHNLGHTFAGIICTESDGNILAVGFGDPDYGAMGINLTWHLKRIGVKNSTYNRSKYGTRLIRDDFYNFKYALIELQHWSEVSKSWREMVDHYNKGSIIKSGEYGQTVANQIRIAKKYIIYPEGYDHQ